MSSKNIVFGFVWICAGMLLPVGAGAELPDAARKAAEAAGVRGFAEIAALHYVFHAKIGEKEIERSWVWRPKQDTVILLPGAFSEKTISYRRSELGPDSSEELRKVDSWFINDQYWLLFPMHLVWDTGVTIEAMPLDGPQAQEVGAAHALRITYDKGVGYTPGDVYELYLDSSYLVRRWVFRKGGSETPTRIADWRTYQSFGPLTLSLDRPAPDAEFRVWFSGIQLAM